MIESQWSRNEVGIPLREFVYFIDFDFVSKMLYV